MKKVWVLMVFALLGCADSRRFGSIYGTYVGNYAGGVETVVIQEGGRYEQSFVLAGTEVYRSSGMYHYEGGVRVNFGDFIYLLDVNSFEYFHPTKAPKIKSLGVYFSEGFEYLVLNEDSKYVLKRE